MERIVYRKTLDVHKNGVQFTLQGFETADKMSRSIEISLMASGDTVDLPLEQLTAIMYVTTPNATEPSINECTIKGNTIIYDVTPIVEKGITEMRLKLIGTRPDGADGVLVSPRFAIEVTESNTDDESVTQTPTYTALENAIATAQGVYNTRIVRVEVDSDCMFRVMYADGTMYESDALNKLYLNGESILARSYAKGGTGTRAGEDTDNSMYYSNVSKSAATEVNGKKDEINEIYTEVQLHGVYTAFSLDFETGEMKYISPLYKFLINKENGKLDVEGETYEPSETIDAIVTEWLESRTQSIVDLESRANYLEGLIDGLDRSTGLNFSRIDGEIDVINQSLLEAEKNINSSKPRIDILETNSVDHDGRITRLEDKDALFKYNVLKTIHPVGSIWIGGKDSSGKKWNPSDDYDKHGVWENIDKEFKATYDSNESLASDTCFEKSNKISTYGVNYTLAGHTVTLSSYVVTYGELSEGEGASPILLGNWDMNKIGIDGTSSTRKIYFTGYCDESRAVVMMYIDLGSGKVYIDDVSTGKIGTGQKIVYSVSFNVTPNRMLDSACDKFYWKKVRFIDTIEDSGSIEAPNPDETDGE